MDPYGSMGPKTRRFLSALITESFKYEVGKTYTEFKLIPVAAPFVTRYEVL